MNETFKKLPEKKQKTILYAAAKIFAEKGYYQANVADICKEAGISNGALYNYFKNKESLFLYVFENGINELADNLFSKYLDVPGSIYDKLYNLLKGLESYGQRDKREIAIYYDLGSKAMNKFAVMLSEKIEIMARDFYIDLIIEGKQNNEIDESVDNEMAAYIIDNNINLFAFSLFSEHYERRFNSYFGIKSKKISTEKKINIIIKLIEQFLS